MLFKQCFSLLLLGKAFVHSGPLSVCISHIRNCSICDMRHILELFSSFLSYINYIITLLHFGSYSVCAAGIKRILGYFYSQFSQFHEFCRLTETVFLCKKHHKFPVTLYEYVGAFWGAALGIENKNIDWECICYID